MKNFITHPIFSFELILLVCLLSTANLNAERVSDSAYIPPIKIIADPSSFGPYFINTQHTNVYFITGFPENTSKVIVKYNDSKGLQLGESKIKEGSDISTVEWTVEAEDVGFVLSPNLNIEVHYKTDSVAIYNIPYIVYPDTVKFFSTAGWGPFISNNYPLSDGWEPVAAVSNTFTVKNFPPRTDTLQFQILAADSTVIKSYWVYAPEGEYLDSAVFANVRMDSLPLSTQYLRTLIWCEGGPVYGLSFDHDLKIIPQKSKLISISNGMTLEDSIGVFVEHDFIGQALLIDSVKHAKINNGPGSWDLDKSLRTIYRGPYCLDIFNRDYTIETWLRLDLKKLLEISNGEMLFMSVDSVWGLKISNGTGSVQFVILSHALGAFTEIITATISYEHLAHNPWHHIAFTSYYSGSGASHVNFYLDGNKWSNVTFHEDDYWNIRNNVDFRAAMHTQPLFLGTDASIVDGEILYSYVTALDEVRIWNGALYPEEIKNNFHKKVLQEDWLLGYWNFDDLRNRLGYISDLSYNNNRGHIEKGATFIPQHPQIQTTPDSILFYSSNDIADSLIYSFIDRNEHIVAGDTNQIYNGGDTLLFDVSSLPDNISKLNIREFSPGCPDTGFLHTYNLEGLAPIPIATPRYNWNTFYYSSDNLGVLHNSIVVSGLPNNATKVELGFQKGDDYYNVDQYTESSIPYRYSLSLNGTDNYVLTNQKVTAPEKLTLSLWFNTKTTKGGQIIGFSDSRNRSFRGNHDREIIIRKDGSLRLYLRTIDSTYILSAVNKYNDGEWHHIAVTINMGAELYVDGCLVDESSEAHGGNYSGYWIIGRNNDAAKLIIENETLSDYFEGSICEVGLTDFSVNKNWINENMYGLVDELHSEFHYRFDEGKGTIVHDYSGGNDGTLMGNTQNWFKANNLSFVVWNHNILDKEPGTYDFFAKVFYRGGPEDGAIYLLGRIHIKDPFPGHAFSYNMKKGFGYFNEGTKLTNFLVFDIDYTNSDSANWKNNFVRYQFFTPEHFLISHNTYPYFGNNIDGQISIDMGDAPPGSYLSVEMGYQTTNGYDYVTDQFSFPIYINPMLAPIVSGNFGPFDQAIAPGSMPQPNTFIITTEILSDLNKVKAKFYDKSSNELAKTDAVKVNDTTWHVTYEMGKLSPPITKLFIEYYLGANPHPALIQGPFPITIHKIRPKWFDFLADTSFHDVQQTGDEVTFSIITPFEKNWLANHFCGVTLPSWLPLIGGSHAKLTSPNTDAMLKWDISSYTLELNEKPHFYQESFFLSGGNSTYLGVDFNTIQDNFFSIDSKNDLIATQNFKIGGTLSRTALDIDFLVKKLNRLISFTGAINPGTVVVQPSFQIVCKGSFEYASRLNLMTDTISGGWGSVGNLDIDANPDHGDAYKNSASFHFYSGAYGIEFDIGLKFFKGLAAAYFGIDGRVVIGYGHSYISIPNNQTQKLKSAAFQIYGRAYIALLWGWYSHNVWGPKMFYSDNFWGSDMSNCFPPPVKKEPVPVNIPANSSWPELTKSISPVHKFTKMPMPIPEPKIVSSGNQQLFTWVEKGNSYGERKLQARYLNKQSESFSDILTVELNKNALNNPVSDAIDKNLSFFCWAQTRYDNNSIQEIKPLDAVVEFIKAQDIWYAIYDQEKDSIIVKFSIEDDKRSITSGRAEANPVMAVISDSRIIITWQVADLDENESELWYLLLEKSGDNWIADNPKAILKVNGIATNLEIAPGQGKAVITWLNTSESEITHNQILTAVFDGENWGAPKVLLDEKYHYYNYQSLKINNGFGGLVVLTFVEDSLMKKYEKLLFVNWDGWNNEWYVGEPIELLVDSINHLQLPHMAVKDNGKAVIAFKVEDMVAKDRATRISQIDLLLGNLDNPWASWKHIEANEFVCDTTKQLADLQITYVGEDTLMILSNEYPMLPTNTSFEPENGIIFGDAYMNLVLRSFAVDELGEVHDVNENDYFTDINNYPENHPKARLYQNYPNPCSEFTTITFDIPDKSKVKLELFDITGNKVAMLLEQQLSAGRYDIELNTSLLKSGTYIYRLTSDNYTTALRMMVGN